MVIDICTTSMRGDAGTRILIQDEYLVATLLDCCRSWVNRYTPADYNSLSEYGFIGAFVCPYTLWLASEPQKNSKHDVLYRVFQQLTPPPSSYMPLCHHIFERTTLEECQSILHTFSSVLRIHGLPRLRASLWACALVHVEEPEIEQLLVDRNGRDEVRDFKLRLIDFVDEAEGEYSVSTPSTGGLQGKQNLGHSEIPYGAEEAPEGAQLASKPAITCQAESDECLLPGPPKRRKTSGYSHTTPERRSSLGSPHRLPFNDNPRKVKVYRCCQNQYHDSTSCSVCDPQPIPIQFTSLLSDAFSSRASLRMNGSGGRITSVHFDDSDDDDSVYGDEIGVKDLDLEQHAPSEDFLDLLRVTGASSPVR